MTTVREATIALMRQLHMTTVFGNPGSTELPFLADWPTDFHYVLALQEASAIGMADGFALATGRCAFVNLHSAAGVGNAMGNIYTAFRNRAPMVILAGQQDRGLMGRRPYLGAESAVELPRPYIKWGCEPARAADVPRALAEAYAIAMHHPRGPVFLSVPSSDWAKPAAPVPPPLTPLGIGVDADFIARAGAAICAAERPAIVLGTAVDAHGAVDRAVTLAERLGADVWAAPVASRMVFPEDHPLFRGFLPAIPAALAQATASYDVLLVAGAPAFTFHVPGAFEPKAREIIHLTDDPLDLANGIGTIGVVAAIGPALAALADAVPARPKRPVGRPAAVDPGPGPAATTDAPLDAAAVMRAIARLRPSGAVVVEEAPSHRPTMQRLLPMTRPGSFFTMASGGLGYGMPAAIGIALADRSRRVICLIGDGSALYSIQALWTAARLKLPVAFVVLNNQGYGAMRAFSALLGFEDVPGIEIDGIDFASLATSLGCAAATVRDQAALDAVLTDAFAADRPTVVDIDVGNAVEKLYDR
jgi:benzoylformate decarboxylase